MRTNFKVSFYLRSNYENKEGKSLADTASLSHDAQFGIHDTTAAITVKDKVVIFLFHRLPFLASFLLFPIMADNGFRYGM